jgi:Cu(I)/Ag(I) efflux system membrane protein CusA/SilA
MDVDTTFEGRERYKVNVRYPRELRDNVEAIRQVLVPVPVQSPRALPVGGLRGAMSPSMGSTNPSPAGGMGSMGAGASPAAIANVAGGGGSMGSGMGSGAGASATAAPSGGTTRAAFVPLGQLARIETVMGPPMIKSEMGQLTGWIYVDIDTDDVGGYVRGAKTTVERDVKLPPGYLVKWTGQYENLERVRERLGYILPLTIGLVFVILYMNFKGAAQSLIVMTTVPFSAVGAVWTLWLAKFNTSIAVWVGMIALLGVAAETASVMVVYLDNAWNDGRKSGAIRTVRDLVDHSLEAGSKRVRPMLMTVMTNVFGLLPILLATGVGADVAKRIAAPMWGGLVSLTITTLLVVPAIYVVWRSFALGRDA